MTYFEQLENRSREIGSLLCVGLDPHPADLPEKTADAALEFCVRIVDETAPYAAAYKPNAAFFEVYGGAGWEALNQLVHHIRNLPGSPIPVLLDAKRGDISSTAAAYAEAVFGTLGVDSVTLNPYLGADSVIPFLSDPDRGVFLLCKTSNPGAADLQDLIAGDHAGEALTLYERVAFLAKRLNNNDNVGLVVGATQLEALARVRAAAPNLWFLAPGVGAQGGDLDAALKAGLRKDGMGMLIPVSRGIARADNPGQAAKDLRDRIAERSAAVSASRSDSDGLTGRAALLADTLLDLGCVRFGEFTLKSGIKSPFYIDLRRLVADPRALALVAEAFEPVLAQLKYDSLAALPYAALPIGTAISLRVGHPMIYPRKEVKAYGTTAVIEGLYNNGDVTVVIDDLITTGGSKFEGIDKLTDSGLLVHDVVVLIDRSTGSAAAELAAREVQLHAVFRLDELLAHWGRSGKVDLEHIKKAQEFLRGAA
jgi:uridine monophosphate synthetase